MKNKFSRMPKDQMNYLIYFRNEKFDMASGPHPVISLIFVSYFTTKTGYYADGLCPFNAKKDSRCLFASKNPFLSL